MVICIEVTYEVACHLLASLCAHSTMQLAKINRGAAAIDHKLATQACTSNQLLKKATCQCTID